MQNNINNTTFPVGITNILWTAIDAGGNTATCEWTVQVYDFTPPSMTCPTILSYETNVGCQAAVVLPPPTSLTDNCPGVNYNTFPSGPFNLGNTNVTYFATDASGNSSFCTTTVFVFDDDPPVIVCPNDYTVAVNNDNCQAFLTQVEPPISVSDNCTNTPNIFVQVFSPSLPAWFNIGENIVTYAAFDNAQNSAFCTFKIIGVDIDPPTIICPNNFTVSTDHNLCSSSFVPSGATAFDDCSMLGMSVALLTPPPYNLGSNTIIFQATDGAGNTATCQTQLIVFDNQPPSITCPSNITVNSIPGQCSSNFIIPPATGSDNCSIVNINQFPILDFYPVGTNIINFTATDLSGNSTFCSMTLTVVDNEPPNISCPNDIVVNSTVNQCSATVTIPPATATDNCGIEAIFRNPTGNNFPVGITAITWTAEDLSGNTATCTMTVQVIDNQPPTIICPANVTASTDPSTCSANVALSAPTTSDNCGFDFYNFSPTAPFPLGTTTVTFVGFDIYGNSSTCTMTVTVFDFEPPVPICSPALSFFTDPGLCTADQDIPDPTVTDNCTTANFSISNNAPSPFPIGNTIVTFLVVDDNGNSATCTTLVSVSDNEAPEIINCPADVTLENLPGTCSAVYRFDIPEASDNCTPTGKLFYSNNAPAGNIFPVGTTQVIFTVTDAAGNATTCAASVTVNDTEPPSITCPPNITLSTAPDECLGYAFLDDPQINDNCINQSQIFDIIQDPNPPSGGFPVGNTVVTFYVSDIFGNLATCTTTVTVQDLQAPQIICPDTIFAATGANSCVATVNFPPATVIENCPQNLVINSPTSPQTFGVGTFTAIYTASDGNLTTSCQVVIVVTGASGINIMCPSNDTVSTDPDQCFAKLNLQADATAVCGLDTIFSDAPATFPLGTTVVTFTAVDLTGKTATCTTTITVEDNQPPQFICPSPITQPTDSGFCTATVFVPAPKFSDNCPMGWTLPSDTVLQNLPIGNPSTTFTFFAFNGNDTVSCSVNITVTGTTNLSITCPPDTIIYTSANNCFGRLQLPNPIVMTDCGLDTIFNDAPPQFPGGTTVVNFTAISLNGDSATCSMTVTVLDSIPPTIVCPQPIVQTVDVDSCNATLSIIFTTNDNCDSNVVVTFLPPNPFPLGTTIATTTATDDAGNTASCTFSVTIVENVPPVLNCPANITANTDPGVCFADLNFANQISITDNCGRTDSLSGQVSGQFQLGQTTVVLTAFDGNGNSSTCQILVEVIDNEPPVINCPANILQHIDLLGCVATVIIPPATASDNCVSPVIPTGPTGGIFPIGTHTVVFSATAGGLTSTCEVLITIIGTTNLSIDCPANVTVDNDKGQCFASLDLPQPTVVADCGLVSLTNDAPAVFPIGTTIVNFVAVDAVGGSVSCSMNVVVNDIELPVLVCPNSFKVAATVGNCEAVVNFPLAQVSDNCPVLPQNLVANLAQGSLLPVGQHLVTYTYTDLLGVVATCSFQITVEASPTSFTIDATICEGRTFTAGGQTFSTAGTFNLTLTNLAGCDSLLTVNLNVIPTMFINRDTAICAGDSIFLAGNWRKNAGIYRDSLLQPQGCDLIITTNLSIYPNPIVEIMGPLSLCPGNLITLSVMLFQQYLWSGGQTTQQITIDQPGIYAVTATDANGCRGSDEIDISEYCGAVLADFSANFDTICTDFYIQFKDESSGAPMLPNRWFWDFGNGNFSTQQNPFTYYPTPGVYPVTLIVSDGIVSDTVTKNIVIYQKPKANFIYSAPEKCLPKEIQYTSQITSVHPLQSVLWNLGDGNTSNQLNPKHLYKTFDTVATSLIIVDKFGCTDSIRQDVKVLPNSFAPEPVLLTPVLCPGESITINGTTYDANNLSGETTLKSFHGCDSIVRVQLSFIPGGNLFLGNDTTICQNQTLTLDAGNATQYLWSTGATTRTILVNQAGIYSVSISASNGNCSAQGKIEVKVDALPNLQANAGIDQEICSFTTNFSQLNAVAPNIGTGQWTSVGAANVDNPTSAKSFVTNLVNGNNFFVWTLSNGQCKNYARDTVNISSVSIAQSAYAGENIAFCASGDITLNATAPATGLGRWSQPAGQNLTFSNINNPKSTISGVSGNNIYTLFWTVENGVCPDSTDQVLVSRSPVVLAEANAGENQTLCDQNFVQLKGNNVLGTQGQWTFVGPAGTATISTPNSPTTNVINIAPGIIRLAWTLSGTGAAGCANYSADTIVVLQSGGLKAEDDVYKAEGQPLTGLNFIGNDKVGAAELIQTPTLLSTPSVGTLTANSDGTFDFNFGAAEPTTVSFRYRICLKKCPDVCSEATVKISTNEPIPPIQRPANVFTPNRDGVADFFEIPNFEQIPKELPISFLVVNRWGDVMFQTDRYDNKWEGTDNNGNQLPDGTYFYVLEGGGGEGAEKRVAGYVTILR